MRSSRWLMMSVTVAVGACCRIRAAAAAACGAAAEVPKNGFRPPFSGSVVLTPSGATTSGFWRMDACGRRLPLWSKKTSRLPPRALNVSGAEGALKWTAPVVS